MSSKPTVKTDGEGHVLTKLWTSYQKAESSDLPKEQLAILDKIKAEARKGSLSWDFYDACDKYVNVASDIDWKQSESLMDKKALEIKEYGEPSLLYFDKVSSYNGLYGADFLAENRTKLRGSFNPEFHKRDRSISGKAYREVLLYGFRSDYEWVQWSMCARGVLKQEELLSYYSKRYPEEQLLRFEQIEAMPEENESAILQKKERMEAFSSEYSEKAVSLLSRQYLLTQSFTELEQGNAASEQYRTLREACAKFERDRSAFVNSRGTSAAVETMLAKSCNHIEQLIETLDAESLDFSISDGEARIVLRNLRKAELNVLKDKKTVYKTTLEAQGKRYYVQDTLVFSLPPLDDGTYRVICSGGKEKVEKEWNKYTLSLATKYDSEGFAAYAADYKSGEPVQDYAEGFVRIKDKKQREEFQVEFRDGDLIRRSKPIRLSASHIGPYKQDISLKSILITDRGAFRPEETVNWKAVLYYSDGSLKSMGSGKNVKVSLRDADNEDIESIELLTNDYGSVSGSFVIPRRNRNGSFSISVYVSDKCVGATYLAVDDYVLPNFKLVFDETEPVRAGDTAEIKGLLKAYSGHNLAAANVTFVATLWGKQSAEGEVEVASDGSFSIKIPTQKDLYQYYAVTVKVSDATGETAEFHTMFSCFEEDDEEEEQQQKEYVFRDKSTQDAIAVEVIASDKEVWAVVELYAFDEKLLDSKMVHFSPKDGQKASTLISYDWKDSFPDAVNLNVLYFQNGSKYSYSITKRRPDSRYDLPLLFTRFLDTTRPGSEYEFTIKTIPGVECAATIFDKSTETIRDNRWTSVRAEEYPLYSMYYDWRTGTDETERIYPRRFLMSKMSMSNDVLMEDADIAYAAPMPMMEQENSMSESELSEVDIREDFAQTVAWEPFLRSDVDGNIVLKFRNADKLSTFCVQILAHDKAMRNAVLRREMTVTLPVKIAVVEPQFLYANDSYIARVTLSNGTSEEVAGRVIINGVKKSVKVPANGSAVSEVALALPKDAAQLELTAVFVPDNAADASDGVRVKLPIEQPVQTITEAHSAVFLPDGDGTLNSARRDELIDSLRKAFVAESSEPVQLKEISILDMVREAVPQSYESVRADAISVAGSLFAAALAQTIGSQGLDVQQEEKLLGKLLSCHNADGGFSWFRGMNSSPLVTAVLLDYFASMRQRGLALPQAISELIPKAVAYTDEQYFDEGKRPYWSGHLSMEQYLYIRSMFPEVEFSSKTSAKWRKAVRAYLLPMRKRGLNAQIYAKARRMQTLQALSCSSEALALAHKLGIRLWAASRIKSSLEKDTSSLLQYAVAHRGGGLYYPNVVMPWRGLLESELYAHSLLCDLLESRGEYEVAEGIRLWLMLQKETQHWDNDPASVCALASVLDGSDATLQTRVLALSKTYTASFEEIKPAGNGFSIELKYYKVASDGGRHLISDGEVLSVGDKVVSVCSIWNEENRSFVKVTLPRPACLRPEHQLSGYGYWGAYRDVKIDRTEFWYESYPEEKTSVEDTYFVTQCGIFHSAAPVIESEYAPHYRANGSAADPLKVTSLPQGRE